MTRRGMNPAQLKQDLTSGDKSYSQQDGGARQGTAASARGRVPLFPTGQNQAEVTPQKELGPQTVDPEIERLRAELRQQTTTTAAAQLLSPQRMSGSPEPSGQTTPIVDLAAVMERQTELLSEVLKRNTAPRLQSTIKVEPRV